MIRLREYQITARDKLVKLTNDHLSSVDLAGSLKLYLHAPTGSGKTVILSKVIRQISDENSRKVAFIWLTLSKGGLNEQTLSSLKNSLNQSGLAIEQAESITSETLEGKVVVIGWSAINHTDKDGNYTNIAMREGEQTNFRELCAQLREQDIPIILIVDEAHHTALSAKSLSIINEVIRPNLLIGASATLDKNQYDDGVSIPFKDVVRSGMIKKRIVKNTFISSKDGFKGACDKLKILIQLAQDSNVEFSPKLLVFCENKCDFSEYLSYLKDIFNWTEENGDVVVWSSERKSDNYLDCKNNASLVKVILTKTAIDTGTDIPSISVIMQLRPSDNDIKVSIQRLGRGLRMPEQKHYGTELDTLHYYVFNDVKFEWDDQFFKDELKDQFEGVDVKVKDIFAQDAIPNLIKSKSIRRDRLVGDDIKFDEYFPDKFKLYKNSMNLSQEYSEEIEENGEIDLANRSEIAGTKKSVKIIDEEEIDRIYQRKIRETFKQTYYHVSTIENSIMEKLECDDLLSLQYAVLNNLAAIEIEVNNAIRLIEDEIDANKICEESGTYCLPLTMEYNRSHENRIYKKFYFSKCYWTPENKWEDGFATIVDSHSNVKWWFFNRALDPNSYSICYNDDKGNIRTFYPDFFVMLSTRKLLIIDTKGNDANRKYKLTAIMEAVKSHNNVDAHFLKAEILNSGGFNFYSDTNENLLDLLKG